MMQIKAYKNELIVALALILLLVAFGYKQVQVSNQNSASGAAATSLQELKEVIALKKIWGDKKITKKVEKLQNIVSPSKITWKRQGKKLTASFKGLSASEFNRLMTKIMNLAVEIQRLEVNKIGTVYQVEFKCKW